MKTRVLALVACAALGSCGGSIQDLPQVDQERWFRCSNSVITAQCGPDQDPIYRGMCGRRFGDEYAETRASNRVRWLVGHGCAEGVASYSDESSGGAR